jgi:GDP-L-fucose synthase
MFFKDQLVLVAGGTGFVGSYFVDELLKRGAHVRVPVHCRPLLCQSDRIEVIAADLTRTEDCHRACRGVRYVVNAAGTVGAAGVNSASSLLGGISENLSIVTRLLHASVDERVERFLLFSSSTGYPALQHPVNEEDFWGEPLHPSYFAYGWARRYGERLAEYVHGHSDTKLAIVRPTAIYGERDNFDLRTSHVIPSLIRRAIARENPFIVWGSGSVVRDFIHVQDLILGSMLVLEKHAEGDAINIGAGSAVTIAQIVEQVLAATGYHDAVVQYDESKPTTIPFRMADVSKAKRLLGYAPTISLADGIRRTVDWYLQQSK